MEEREISIIDLMVEILLHWRVFLIWMIGGAVLLGVFSYMHLDNAAKKQQTQAEAMAEGESKKWFTEEEMLNASYVADYEKVYLEKEAYREKSPLMQLDTNSVCKAEATVAVIAEDRQQSCDIAGVYRDIAESSEFISKVAEDTSMETLGISELLYLDGIVETDTMTSNNKTVVTVQTGESNTFRIMAVHEDEKACRAMLDSAVSFLMEKQSNIEEALGAHEISVVNECFGIVSDLEIARLQKGVLRDIADMKREVSEAKKDLSSKEQQYYEFLLGGVTEADRQPAAVSTPGISMKFVLLGAALAAFLYAFILLLIYIFNTKIRITDNTQELYGLPQLGVIPATWNNKKVLGVVDKWIVSIRYRNKRQFTPEEALELAIVAAKMAAGRESLQEVCLLGCGLKERALEICEKIKDKLEEEGIHAVILNNVLYDAGMLAELEGAKGAILVESAGSTLYSEVAEELELLKRQGIKALGGIVVE